MVEKRDYTVRLERVFQGPLDLLLHLVREQEVEIHEIEIARIIDDYLAYLDKLEALELEVAGDFLVMAATLMAIKSRSLLPGEEVDLEDELDPKDELIQRLLEYRRFRNAADTLEDGFKERALQAERGYHEKIEVREREFEMGELTVWDLLSTFSRLMRETLADRPLQVHSDPRPLRFYIDQVVHRLRTGEHISLRGLMHSFDALPPREALIGSFCALLELVRLELIAVRQSEDEDDIEIHIREEHTGDIEDVINDTIFDENAAREAALEAPIAPDIEAPPDPDGDAPQPPSE